MSRVLFLCAKDTSVGGDGDVISFRNLRGKEANRIYGNFLKWLFATFRRDEVEFRDDLLRRTKIHGGSKILITGCGNGEDIDAARRLHKDFHGEIYAQDLSAEMAVFCAKKYSDNKKGRVCCSISDAARLPFENDYFDAVFHFGGINLFSDVKQSILEMARVTRNGGRVVFGDEGIAPWLRNTEYYAMMVENNRLWAADAPLSLLPEKADNVRCSWVLGNCFYVIEFDKDEGFPDVDIDVPHVGKRGGSIRTRYFGKIEGVTLEAREIAIQAADAEGVSLHDWLDKLIKNNRKLI